jgi:hypothetical protein
MALASPAFLYPDRHPGDSFGILRALKPGHSHLLDHPSHEDISFRFASEVSPMFGSLEPEHC